MGNVSGNMLTRSSLGRAPLQRREIKRPKLGCGNGWILRDRVEFVVGSGAMPPVQDKRRRAVSTVSGPEAVNDQDFLAEYAETIIS